MFKSRLLLASLTLALALAPVPAALAGYKLVSHIKVGDDGGWDYLTTDAAARRLYVSHGAEVVVIDLDTEAVVKKITDLKGVHGIALAKDVNRGFISNGGAGTVTVFSTETLGKLAEVKAGENPDAILYEPVTQRIFAFNGRSKDITVIDAGMADVVGTIALTGKPEFAAADGQGMVYLNLEDQSELLQIDAKSMQIKNHWPVAPGEEPSALAMDRETHRLFIGCGNQKLVVMDAVTGKVVATPAIGEGVDAACFDPGTKMIFTSQGSGTVTAIHEGGADKYSVVETITTAKRAHTMALDPKTHKLYVPTAEFEPAPAATADNPHPRPHVKAGTFEILVLGQ